MNHFVQTVILLTLNYSTNNIITLTIRRYAIIFIMENSLHPIKKIDITMHVKSLEKTFKWYHDVLGWNYHCDLKDKNGECLFGDVHYSYEPNLSFNLSKTKKTTPPFWFSSINSNN